MNKNLYPKQSFEHTLKEISVNRESPCEVVRELLSNSYDANASKILIFPLLEREGLIFFDDGMGLSAKEEDGISPYVAFFSIGFGTKTKGEQIGYKCQGSKLCFASNRFALITRCDRESEWRYIIIENPKSVLNSDYDITPQTTLSPDKILKNFLSRPDKRTKAILDFLDEKFFSSSFKRGTMIVIENFEVTGYEKYFSGDTPEKSYLYNYIRFYTAHGETRLLKKELGFSPSEINSVTSNFKPQDCELRLWMPPSEEQLPHLVNCFVEIPKGWPYLEVNGQRNTKQRPESPANVSQLRKGSFYSRHATTFKFGGQVYTLIFAIDGKRKALDEYPGLDRQRSSRCGISLSSQRGVFLSSHGVKICSYNEIFSSQLPEKFSSLRDATDHFVFFIDGDFELITNRNQLAEKSKSLLTDMGFISNIKEFLEEVWKHKEHILQELLQRINREISENTENNAVEAHNDKKNSITDGRRDFFRISNVEPLKDKWFVTPIVGEEHFIGALYTLFSSLVTAQHSLSAFWKRPLTFSGVGIDSIATDIDNGEADFSPEKLMLLEYKYLFSPKDEFNHPLSITNRIICWRYSEVKLGDNDEDTTEVGDIYGYTANVKKFLKLNEVEVGFEIGDIRKRVSPREIGGTITVLSLESLLKATFEVEWKKNKPQQSTVQKNNPRRRKRNN